MPSISLSAVPVTQESTLEAPRITTKKWRVLSVERYVHLLNILTVEESNVIINQ